MTALHRVIVLAALVTSGPAMAQYTDGVVDRRVDRYVGSLFRTRRAGVSSGGETCG